MKVRTLLQQDLGVFPGDTIHVAYPLSTIRSRLKAAGWKNGRRAGAPSETGTHDSFMYRDVNGLRAHVQLHEYYGVWSGRIYTEITEAS